MKVQYREIEGNSKGYLALLGVLGALILIGLGAVWHMEHEGHWVTGMDNQVVWGMPHVFAIFLIVAASGALNVASISSVFHKTFYKPMARLSALLAITLLVGGLVVLVLDLGQPDRLLVAMTHYNFKSIFAWNVLLYNGFIAIVGLYLWFMMDRKLQAHSSKVGVAAFIWRLILTTGTGSIFGFLVARQAYDAAIMAPMFIIMSFAFGLAVFLLVLMASYNWTGRPLGDVVIKRLKNLLGVFVAAVLYFEMARHVTNLYATEHHGIEAFILRDGGVYTFLFWVVQIGLGTLLPLALLFCPRPSKSRLAVAAASVLVIIGGLAQLYVIVIGGQAYPLVLFPGYEMSSAFQDGIVNAYSPTIYEILLGVGGVAFALILTAVALKVLNFLPTSLADEVFEDESAKA
ncbi:MAG: NrfD/PsrC family molybdoenzyme membrane anchor subunit [Gammaproteobacteria bacterium]